VLKKVGVDAKKVDSYRNIVEDDMIEEVYNLGRDLHGIKVCHISSSSFGGGVPEILGTMVPLECDLDIEVDWYALSSSDEFFRIGKIIHNALQGAPVEINDRDKALYLQLNRDCAYEFEGVEYDVVIMHSHHFFALPNYMDSNGTRWVWRSHLDTASPHSAVWEFIKPFAEKFHGAIFTMKEFIPPDFHLPQLGVIAPAIDPLNAKNRDIPPAQCIDYVSYFGIDPDSPILLHTSRLDQWKDPLGLIRCYYLVKDYVPKLQLVISSSLSLDDPETFSTLRILDSEAAKDEDIHVYTDMDGMGDKEVNALQRLCDAGVLMSQREGFGLSVSEILWKGKPVLCKRVGGMTLQLPEQLDYCFIGNTEECADKLIHLLNNWDYASELGDIGREHVRRNFLTPRLLRDELAFIKSALD